jgi:molybdate transport system ATP-binding protein
MLEVRVCKLRGDWRLDAEFSMPTPGIVALFGRSGCGKSTLVDIIAGLVAADSGRVALDGHVLLDVAQHCDVKPERRRIGYVFQDAKLFPHLSVAGNLSYAARRAGSPEIVSFDAVIDLLALGPLLARRTQGLSGGERQRVAIGRALLCQPRLLLLDEPLAALDAARRAEVLPYLEALRDQLAVPMVYVSHQFDEVLRLATHLVLMDAGKTVAQGDLGAMSLRPELRAIIGAEAVGSIVDAEVLGIDSASGLHRVRVGAGVLALRGAGAAPGSRWRVQILARDVIVATEAPRSLSVRNELAGTIVAIAADEPDADLVSIDVGGATILARITSAATRSLGLHPGMAAWALVKSVSLSGRSLARAPLTKTRA